MAKNSNNLAMMGRTEMGRTNSRTGRWYEGELVNKYVGNSRFVCPGLIAAIKVAHSRTSLSVPQGRLQPLPG